MPPAGKTIRSPKRKRILWILALILLLLLIGAAAAAIFLFSTEDKAASTQTSVRAANWLLDRIYPGYARMTVRQRRHIRLQYFELLRELAHGVEFLALGFLLCLFLHALKVRRASLLAWLGCTLYGAGDELHQLWVDGRGAELMDVGIDSLGALLGVLLAMGILSLVRRIRRRKDPPSGEDPGPILPAGE